MKGNNYLSKVIGFHNFMVYFLSPLILISGYSIASKYCKVKDELLEQSWFSSSNNFAVVYQADILVLEVDCEIPYLNVSHLRCKIHIWCGESFFPFINRSDTILGHSFDTGLTSQLFGHWIWQTGNTESFFQCQKICIPTNFQVYFSRDQLKNNNMMLKTKSNKMSWQISPKPFHF